MLYIVYKITNNVDNKFYIGCHKTDDINDGYMGSGKYLKRAIRKHGLECFNREILFVFDSAEEMYEKEKELVTEDFCKQDNTYNIKIGGYGGWDHITWKGKKRSKESRQKMSQSKKITSKGEGNSFYGKTHSEKSKKKIGEKSKKRSEKWVKNDKHINNKKISCPHCDKEGQERAMKRWHFNNCKMVNI